MFAKFLTKFVININRNPANGFKLLKRGRKERLGSLQESNDGFFHKDESIKNTVLVQCDMEKAETTILENTKSNKK